MPAEYGLRWQEFNRHDQLVTKTKFFDSDKDRNKFFKKLEKKDNFCCLVATCED